MKKKVFSFIIPILFLLFVYSAGCRRAGAWLVKEDIPEHADAIVLLMGSFPDRVLQVNDSWKRGLADRIIIVEESMGAFAELEARGASIMSNSEQAAHSLIALGIPGDSITILPGNAQSTLDEAISTRNYIKAHNSTDTILLVSSPAHMRRAYIIFRKTMRDMQHSVVIGCQPSTYSSFDRLRWWRKKEDIQLVVTEILKTGSFMLIEKHNTRNLEP
jgi:uncharacterized SAM-binding protein YcdF (DUF218 family)